MLLLSTLRKGIILTVERSVCRGALEVVNPEIETSGLYQKNSSPDLVCLAEGRSTLHKEGTCCCCGRCSRDSRGKFGQRNVRDVVHRRWAAFRRAQHSLCHDIERHCIEARSIGGLVYHSCSSSTRSAGHQKTTS